MIIFQTPQTLPLDCLTTFGASIKPGPDPFGRFGTGLKHALAVLLAKGQKVEIALPEGLFVPRVVATEIRGKVFQKVFLEGPCGSVPLPFTLDLAGHWELWMAYRELYSNTLDEGGIILEIPGQATPVVVQREGTVITVSGQDFEALHWASGEFLLGAEAPLWEGDGVALCSGSSKFLFHKGIRVAELSKEIPWKINITSHLELTEDRSVRDLWQALQQVAKALLVGAPEGLFSEILSSPLGEMLDWDQYETPCSAVAEVCWKRIGQKQSLPQSLRQTLQRYYGTELVKAEAPPVPKTLFEALAEEPPLSEAKPRWHFSEYSAHLEARLEEALARAKWWKDFALGQVPVAEEPPLGAIGPGRAELEAWL